MSMTILAKNRVRQLRNDRKLSLKALAEAAGLSISTVQHSDNPLSSPRIDTAVRIADALGVDVRDLLVA